MSPLLARIQRRRRHYYPFPPRRPRNRRWFRATRMVCVARRLLSSAHISNHVPAQGLQAPTHCPLPPAQFPASADTCFVRRHRKRTLSSQPSVSQYSTGLAYSAGKINHTRFSICRLCGESGTTRKRRSSSRCVSCPRALWNMRRMAFHSPSGLFRLSEERVHADGKNAMPGYFCLRSLTLRPRCRRHLLALRMRGEAKRTTCATKFAESYWQRSRPYVDEQRLDPAIARYSKLALGEYRKVIIKSHFPKHLKSRRSMEFLS